MLIQLVISDIGKTLSSLQESFTTREWSIVIWIGIFIIFQMKRSSFRSSLLQIVKLLCSKNILMARSSKHLDSIQDTYHGAEPNTKKVD